MFIWAKRLILALVVLFMIAQFFRPTRTNPPVDPTLEINASQSLGPAIHSIFARSCNDCHSDLTVWPWYSSVAPASWLLSYDVNKGLDERNLQGGVRWRDAGQRLHTPSPGRTSHGCRCANDLPMDASWPRRV